MADCNLPSLPCCILTPPSLSELIPISSRTSSSMSSNALVERARKNLRSRPVQAATAALTLLAITYSIWSWTTAKTGGGSETSSNYDSDKKDGNSSAGNGPSGSGTGNADATGDGKASSSSVNPNRPTLSLSFPPSFDSTDSTALDHLKLILTILSPSFLIHLIVPTPGYFCPSAPKDNDELFENLEDSSPIDTSGLESIDELAYELSSINLFDTRRILEYSSDKGRAALARSLKSGAHVEVLLSGSGSGPSTLNSNLSSQHQAFLDPKEKEERLKEYKPTLDLLRKSCGLIVFLVLPSPITSTTSSKNASNSDDTPDLSIEGILGPFGSGVHVPGIRVFDLRERATPGRRRSRSGSRSGKAASVRDEGEEDQEFEEEVILEDGKEESEETDAWREGAERVKGLRKGWR